MMSYYSVLRIGPLESNDGNANLLRNAITAHFKGSTDGETNCDSVCVNANRMTISNRYFNAEVLLVGLHESTAPIIAKEKSQCHLQEDGIILVFNSSPDPSSSTPVHSFEALDSIHESAELTDRAGELLRLCVGVSLGPSPLSDGTKTSEGEYSRRVLWCLDRGYEYVEANVTTEGLKMGHNERDKDGFARIVEAISSCIWSSHVMKHVSESATPKIDSQDPAFANEHDKSVNDVTVSFTGGDDEREVAAIASLMQGVDESQELYELTEQSTTENRHQEIAFRELEQVMSEAKRIREASQNDSMSDEERRKKAGDTAVRLMGILERLGFDEEDDSDAIGVE